MNAAAAQPPAAQQADDEVVSDVASDDNDSDGEDSPGVPVKYCVKPKHVSRLTKLHPRFSCDRTSCVSSCTTKHLVCLHVWRDKADNFFAGFTDV